MILYVLFIIYIVGIDFGNGFFFFFGLKVAFCKFNESFEEVNIQFFMVGEINYLMNLVWYFYEIVLEGVEMMFVNNVDGILNIYFVNDFVGNCGYNFFYVGIVMCKSCFGLNDNIWVYEIGYVLVIFYFFLGWEGGISYDGL